MPLVGAAFCPHPPLLIPEVGKEMTTKVRQTFNAMKILAASAEKLEVETIIVISPHNLIYPDAFNINTMSKSAGDFGQFGALEVKMSFNNDDKLAARIVDSADSNSQPVIPYNNQESVFTLDHGSMVPLYYFSDQFGPFKIIPMAYSWLSKIDHFIYGQFLGETLKSFDTNIFLIASGDLSHRTLESGETGDIARQFDSDILNGIKAYRPDELLEIDNQTREIAGECGYNSLMILLGVLDSYQVESTVLSYESPFGVGYLVASFDINK